MFDVILLLFASQVAYNAFGVLEIIFYDFPRVANSNVTTDNAYIVANKSDNCFV